MNHKENDQRSAEREREREERERERGRFFLPHKNLACLKVFM
jgi:hypothetical protein